MPDPMFDPEGAGYDYTTAAKYNMKRDVSGHFGSLAPLSGTRGLVLKGRKHEAWDLMVGVERLRGYKIIKVDDRYYSVPTGERSN